MALVSVTVNGRAYNLDCKDGQEEHAREMAQYVEERVLMMQKAGFRGESRPIVMASLLMADELADASRQKQEALAQQEVSALDDDAFSNLSQQIEALAVRAESLADLIENTYKENSGAS